MVYLSFGMVAMPDKVLELDIQTWYGDKSVMHTLCESCFPH
jgi:hypothetical protein